METDQENEEEESEDDIDNDIANGISDFEGIEAMSDWRIIPQLRFLSLSNTEGPQLRSSSVTEDYKVL